MNTDIYDIPIDIEGWFITEFRRIAEQQGAKLVKDERKSLFWRVFPNGDVTLKGGTRPGGGRHGYQQRWTLTLTERVVENITLSEDNARTIASREEIPFISLQATGETLLQTSVQRRWHAPIETVWSFSTQDVPFLPDDHKLVTVMAHFHDNDESMVDPLEAWMEEK